MKTKNKQKNKIPEGYYDDSDDLKELAQVATMLGVGLLIPKIVNWRNK